MWKPNTDLAQAEEKFKELAEAYSILSNADKRKHYDLEAWIWMSLAMSDSDSGMSCTRIPFLIQLIET